MKLQAKRLASFALFTLLGSAAFAAVWNSGGSELVMGRSRGADPGEASTAAFTWVVEPFALDGEVEILLLRMGYTKEAITAAGINSAELQALLSSAMGTSSTAGLSASQGIQGAPAQLAELDAQVAEARVRRDALKRKVQSGLATEQEVADLQVAKADFEAAGAARVAFFDSTCMALCALAPASDAQPLMQACRNKKWKNLPAKYLTVERTDHEWFEIRNALASKRTHEQLGEPVPGAATAFLAQLDAGPEVAAASACCDAEQASIDATWAAIFGE